MNAPVGQIVTSIFPISTGAFLPYDVEKVIEFSTRKIQHISGHEVRNALWPYPRYEFNLHYDLLRTGKYGYTEYDQIKDHFLSMSGGFQSFYFTDRTDNSAIAVQLIPVPGQTLVFYLARGSTGGYREPVGGINTTITPLTVFVDGNTVPAAQYTFDGGNRITFSTLPTGSVLSATFKYYFLCVYKEDMSTYKNFAQDLWSMGKLNLRSVLVL